MSEYKDHESLSQMENAVISYNTFREEIIHIFQILENLRSVMDNIQQRLSLYENNIKIIKKQDDQVDLILLERPLKIVNT